MRGDVIVVRVESAIFFANADNVRQAIRDRITDSTIGVVLDAEHQLALIEEYGGMAGLGGEMSAPHFASAWAHANNTPFQWGKQMASHLGGTRDPMVISWPARIPADATVRSQFTHCIDVVPTVLEVAGIPQPTMVDGIAQEPMDGTSFDPYDLKLPEGKISGLDWSPDGKHFAFTANGIRLLPFVPGFASTPAKINAEDLPWMHRFLSVELNVLWSIRKLPYNCLKCVKMRSTLPGKLQLWVLALQVFHVLIFWHV
jgi:hypothetical protein